MLFQRSKDGLSESKRPSFERRFAVYWKIVYAITESCHAPAVLHFAV